MFSQSYCDGCGRIHGERVSLAGWHYWVGDHASDPWLMACSIECRNKVEHQLNQQGATTND